MQMIDITVRKQVWSIRLDWLRSAMCAWDQFRHEHKEPLSARFIKTKVREICNAIVPYDPEDDWLPEQLARAVLSRLGRRGGRKKLDRLPSSVSVPNSPPTDQVEARQLTLPFMT